MAGLAPHAAAAAAGASAREALKEDGFETPAGTLAGYLFLGNAVRTTVSPCVTPGTGSGPVRSGCGAADFAPTGRVGTTGILGGIAMELKLGNRLADLGTFTAQVRAPAGVPPTPGAALRFALLVDSDADHVADRCLALSTSVLGNIPAMPSSTAGWQRLTLASSDRVFADSTPDRCDTASTPELTLAQMQLRYPAGQVLGATFHVEAPAGAAWPAGRPIQVDDLGFSFVKFPGLLVDRLGTLAVDERGPTADTLTYELAQAPYPGETVTVTLAEAVLPTGTPHLAISPNVFSFTSANWNQPVTVTLTAVDDYLYQSPSTYTTNLTGAVTSANGVPSYGGVLAPTLQVQVRDNDPWGFYMDPPAFFTSEAAGPLQTRNFTVRLTVRPLAAVELTAQSMDTFEGSLTPSRINFTLADWNDPHPMYVNASDDWVDDGDWRYAIRFDPAFAPADPVFDGLQPPDVMVTNLDDDTYGLAVSRIVPLAEGGPGDSVTVALTSQPLSPVTLTLVPDEQQTSSRSTLYYVGGPKSPQQLGDWNVPQTLKLTAIDDRVEESSGLATHPGIVAVRGGSLDPVYNRSLTPSILTAIKDNDVSGIVLVAAPASVAEGGPGRSYSLKLATQPRDDVVVTFDGGGDLEAFPPSLTFTGGPASNPPVGNWNVTQSVTVVAVDDRVAEGTQKVSLKHVTSSTDPVYDATSRALTLDVADNDVAGIRIAPVGALRTTETVGPGRDARFFVTLSSQPEFDVAVVLASADEGEGSIVTPSDQVLTFTGGPGGWSPTGNWAVGQEVVVRGANEWVDDGDRPYNITFAAASSDAGYSSLVHQVAVTSVDDDTAGYVLTAVGGVTTSEGGGQQSFNVRLSSQPLGAVDVALVPDKPVEGFAEPGVLRFVGGAPSPDKVGDWHRDQRVMVTGLDDCVADGPILYDMLLVATSDDDVVYPSIQPGRQPVRNLDDDTAGLLVEPGLMQLTEEPGPGQSGIFTVRLRSQPAKDVVVTASEPNDRLSTAAPLVIQGAPASWPCASGWDQPHQVTVKATQDAVRRVTPATLVNTPTGDPVYQALAAQRITVDVIDDDSAAFDVLMPADGSLDVMEGGVADSFRLKLGGKPSADVTFALDGGGQVEVSPTVMSFDATDWDKPKLVVVKAIDDLLAEGVQHEGDIFILAASTDAFFGGESSRIPARITDDDVPGVAISPDPYLVRATYESGGRLAYTVRLTTPPTALVEANFAPDKPLEGKVVEPADGVLRFTPDDWLTPQTLAIEGLPDGTGDGSQDYQVRATVVSEDPMYQGVGVAPIKLRNFDMDGGPNVPIGGGGSGGGGGGNGGGATGGGGGGLTTVVIETVAAEKKSDSAAAPALAATQPEQDLGDAEPDAGAVIGPKGCLDCETQAAAQDRMPLAPAPQAYPLQASAPQGSILMGAIAAGFVLLLGALGTAMLATQERESRRSAQDAVAGVTARGPGKASTKGATGRPSPTGAARPSAQWRGGVAGRGRT